MPLTQRNYRVQCGIGYGFEENCFCKRLVNPALYVISIEKSVKTRDPRTVRWGTSGNTTDGAYTIPS